MSAAEGGRERHETSHQKDDDATRPVARTSHQKDDDATMPVARPDERKDSVSSLDVSFEREHPIPLPETSRPPRTWGSLTSVKTSQRDLRSIMAEQAAKRTAEAASHTAAIEQEEELVRLALGLSLSEMNVCMSASPLHSFRSLNLNYGSNRSLGSETFALKVQEEVETTEGFIDSPHAGAPTNRRFLVRPSTSGASSQRSLLSTCSSSRSIAQSTEDPALKEARRFLSPEEVIQIERALDSRDAGHGQLKASMTNERSDSHPHDLYSAYDLDQAANYLSPREVDQIEKALRESKTTSSNAHQKPIADKHPPHAGDSSLGEEPELELGRDSCERTRHLSWEETECIEKALREADEADEQKSIRLAIQMLHDDGNELQSSRRPMQGNVRTMTLAEYNAGRTASVGAFCRNSPPRARHPLEEAEAEALSAGYKMNSNSRHQWTRRDHSSILGPNNEIRTKHDASLQGKANAQRLGLDIDDTDEGIIVGNKAYNSFMQNVRRNKKGVAAHGIGRAGSDADRTKGGSMNQSLRSEISRAINHGLIDKCNGVVKEGKEAVVYHAEKGTESEGFDVVRISYFFWSRSPTENRTSFSHTATCAFFATQAVKVFKRIQEFKTRSDYVVGDPRYAKAAFRSVGPREQLALWSEKEFRNLVKANRAGVPVPSPLLFKDNVLYMRYIGVDGWPSPQLRELDLRRGSKRWATLYAQTMNAVKT
jgi:serine/threonine-protein kinase RIO1